MSILLGISINVFRNVQRDFNKNKIESSKQKCIFDCLLKISYITIDYYIAKGD